MNLSTEMPRSAAGLYQALSWVVTLLVPAALALGAVRLMLTPIYINYEYNLPGFPPDPYGFTQAERLHYAEIARQYLLNPADISFLGDLRFANGQPVYNQRELGHMVDVKRTVQAALTVWYVSLGVLLALGIWAWLGGWGERFRQGLVRGGWLTVLLLVTIVAFVVLSFNTFFVTFHNVFFAPGTWTFEYSDTLIRLFPERFWQDIFIWVGGITIVWALLLALGLRRWPRR